jgi:type II secretory pathway pseudopilin PulG
MRQTEAGFSYIWVLLAVAAIGVGLSAAVEGAAVAVQRDQERMLLAIGDEYRRAIQSYYEVALEGGRHQYPPSLDALLRDDRFPGVRRHLRKIYHDPLTGKAEWGLVRFEDRVVGVYSLSLKAALKRRGFPPEYLRFTDKGWIRDWVFAYPTDVMDRLPLPQPPAAR